MNRANFRFYAQLNYFLPPSKRKITFVHYFKKSRSIKDAIEALGVPHTEVDLIIANKESVDFCYLLQDGDLIGVYPRWRSIDITPIVKVRPIEMFFPRFILDVHLGKLAKNLRLLGFDTLYRNDYNDEELAEISRREQRILLTRDVGLLMRSAVNYGYYVRNTNPWKQLLEVVRHFDLLEKVNPFQRCLCCNGSISLVDKKLISDRLPEKAKQYYDEFYLCRQCERIYWKGSHHQKMQKFIEQIHR